MSWIELDKLPVVQKIMRQAEAKVLNMTGVKVNVSIASADISDNEARRNDLRELVCKMYSVSWPEIMSDSRKGELVDARHAYMYLACTILKQSSNTTGEELNRDHSTVLSALEKIKGYYKVNDFYTIKLTLIINKFNEKQVLHQANT